MSAAGGAVVGAMLGAVGGGNPGGSMAAGAVIGGVGGSASQGLGSGDEFRRAYARCMEGRALSFRGRFLAFRQIGVHLIGLFLLSMSILR